MRAPFGALQQAACALSGSSVLSTRTPRIVDNEWYIGCTLLKRSNCKIKGHAVARCLTQPRVLALTAVRASTALQQCACELHVRRSACSKFLNVSSFIILMMWRASGTYIGNKTRVPYAYIQGLPNAHKLRNGLIGRGCYRNITSIARCIRGRKHCTSSGVSTDFGVPYYNTRCALRPPTTQRQRYGSISKHTKC